MIYLGVWLFLLTIGDLAIYVLIRLLGLRGNYTPTFAVNYFRV